MFEPHPHGLREAEYERLVHLLRGVRLPFSCLIQEPSELWLVVRCVRDGLEDRVEPSTARMLADGALDALIGYILGGRLVTNKLADGEEVDWLWAEMASALCASPGGDL